MSYDDVFLYINDNICSYKKNDIIDIRLLNIKKKKY